MKRYKLIRARLIQNLSVADAARLSGISGAFYRQIEAGVRNPALKTIFAIMKTLDNTDINLFRKG
ncbi:MAG TPA: helix-turn-helix transcriptional regulator [Clostridia bacterium]|nr:helix-turn-helix transcriptional regulator [Clostridia bacterium]